MYYQEILPPPSLKSIVRFFWILESDSAFDTSAKYTLFAEGFPGIVFFFNSRHGAINGQTAAYNQLVIPGKFKMFGAYLFPYCIPMLFGVPADQLTNAHIRLFDFEGSHTFLNLEEKIFEASTDDQRIHILTDFLLSKQRFSSGPADGKFSACVHHIIQSNGNISPDWLIQTTGLSTRQLQRRFKTFAGFSPKLYLRLMRFHATLRMARREATTNLPDLAYAAGYYDQSHFINEFKEFSGLSPRKYFYEQGVKTADNFVHLLD